MSNRLNVSFDSELLEAISADFDLRGPNKQALRKLVFTLDGGDYDPSVMQVLNLATGVGKTYLMAAFIEYLRRQGVGNVMIVTPGKVVQRKTVQNFTPGSSRYIKGSPVPPEVVTPQDYSAWVARVNGDARLSFGREVPVLAFVFNIQQLIAPKSDEGDTHGGTVEAARRKPRKFDENAGVLFDYLKGLDDLVVIADESHLYGASAVAFRAALEELNPALAVGLTASPDRSDEVIFKYPLYQAIADKYVKAPVLAFRKDGYGEDLASEEQQLRDAMQLREIKAAHYKTYAEQTGQPPVNAVMFVVCSDVDHATQVAALLRTPEFFGRDSAVLQVDSKHEDEATQALLEGLDSEYSPVLAVVSVNKLKEGWDVKNIAVVVTLRAMASEVLTQQTMGRGLRLPYGKYTGQWQIDQLDIISHQSFRELLEAENVLAQFGLEEAATAEGGAGIRDRIEDLDGESPGRSGGEQSSSRAAGLEATESTEGDGTHPGGFGKPAGGPSGLAPTVGISDLESKLQESIEPEIVYVERTPDLAEVSYLFPVATVSAVQPPIDLSEISDRTLEDAAKRVTTAGDVLHRKEIVAALGKKLRTADAESADVDSIHVSEEEALAALVKLIVNMALVPKTPGNAAYIERYLAPKFVSFAGIDQWTVKALGSASALLQNVVSDHITATLRETKEETTIRPKKLPGPGYSLPVGGAIHDQIEDRADFQRGRHYGPWNKSLFNAEAFDSYTGEYQLARLLNRDPHIVWWHRLHPSDQAFVYYNSKDRYFPDFVALDDEGVHWIIEGKDERGRGDAVVQAKRKAAESLVRRLIAEEAYVDQKWGYLIAHEGDTDRAESWADLKALAQPVSNAL